MSKLASIYARCSTTEQFPENQIRVLRELAERNGDTIVSEFIDKGISGVKRDRDALNQMLSAARSRKFTKLYVVSIDRLSRSVKDLIETVETLNELGVTIVFQRENIDTTSAMGQFFLTVLGSLAQFEREIMRERIKQGIDRAKSQGRKMGRPTKMNDSLRNAVKLLYTKGASVRTICGVCGIGVGTCYKVIEEIRGEDTGIGPINQWRMTSNGNEQSLSN
jgi:DNA invertase Pin-like site-specific DNA recombinase